MKTAEVIERMRDRHTEVKNTKVGVFMQFKIEK